MDTEEKGGLVRLTKLVAARGVASRREAEEMIEAGRITLNGEVVKKNTLVTEADDIKVDGRPLPAQPPTAWYLLYKPKGYITGRDDPEGRASVFDLLGDLGVRVEPVGRLDFDTEGALVLTNDGVTAAKLAHPRTKVPKRYLAKVYRTPGPDDLRAIENGEIYLEDGVVQPARVRVVEQTDTENAWVEITVTEGRNRLVRRLFQQIHHPVAKLRRESFATISIRGLERGQFRMLTGEEVRRLKDLAEGIEPQRAGKKRLPGHALPKPKGRIGLRKAKEKEKAARRAGEAGVEGAKAGTKAAAKAVAKGAAKGASGEGSKGGRGGRGGGTTRA